MIQTLTKNLLRGIQHPDFFSRLARELTGTRINFAEPRDRAMLVVRARWFLLSLIAITCACAGTLFLLSDYGFFLTWEQLTVLGFSTATVLGYNGLIYLFRDRIRDPTFINYLQILLDFILVTLLIHFSGGVASWFWPIYLIVTMEAAILLDRSRDVWFLGYLGGLLYGVVLIGEYFRLWPPVQMPFVDPALYHDGLHLILMWIWVSMLNAAMAAIGAYLMRVIRRENHELRTSRQRLSEFLEKANDLIFGVDGDGRIVYANRAWRRTLSRDKESFEGMSLLDFVHPDFHEDCHREFRRVVEGDDARIMQGRFITCDGRAVEVEGSLTRSRSHLDDSEIFWIICRDITERKQAQEQLYHLAHHDMLTGLPNRAYFLDRLQHSMALSRRLGKQVAILFLDLDRFKIINDTLGHALGDSLLKEMGRRLKDCVRQVDTVARMGGDEFTVCLGNVDDTASVEKIAKKILKKLAQPVNLDGHELFITTSIGISLFPGDNDDPNMLIKKADIAMYHAKGQGRNNYQFYQPAIDFDAGKRLDLENAIRKALGGNQFKIFYQPKVEIASGRITAMEALLRWNHPQLGILPPGEFIPIAEETGLIFAIGEWVLREACLQNRRWQERGLPPVRVAVNISGYQLQQKNLVEKIRNILQETGLDPRYLEVEVTETVVMQNPEAAVAILQEVKNLGIQIAIDDFGTGYSSLAHLKRFSVNTLKIDKSFMRDIEINSTDAAIAAAIIAMGNSLQLEVIAEGVETEGQLEFLRQKSCHEMQGFLFSQPLPAEQAEALLRKHGPFPVAPQN